MVDIYAKCGSIEDAWGLFNKLPSGNVVMAMPYLEDVPCRGMVRRFLNILDKCVKKVYSKIISLLFVFCQLVAMQVWWRRHVLL